MNTPALSDHARALAREHADLFAGMTFEGIYSWLDERGVSSEPERQAFMREIARHGVTKSVLVENLQAAREQDAIAHCEARIPLYAACREEPMALVVSSLDGNPLLCQRHTEDTRRPAEPWDRLQYSLLKACIGIAGRTARQAGYSSVRLDVYVDDGWLQHFRDPALGVRNDLHKLASEALRVALHHGVIPYTHLIPAYTNKARPILRSRLRRVVPDHSTISDLLLPCTENDAGDPGAFASPND